MMKDSAVFIGSTSTFGLGIIWAAMSNSGLVAVEFSCPRPRFEVAVRKLTRRDIRYDLSYVSDATRQIREYVEGLRRTFNIHIDWSVLASDFQRRALRAVASIPYGQTRTYADIADQIGHPGAPRAVGRANAANPMPLVIPCHRLVGRDGKLHGYGGAGGLNTKSWLLHMEQARY